MNNNSSKLTPKELELVVDALSFLPTSQKSIRDISVVLFSMRRASFGYR